LNSALKLLRFFFMVLGQICRNHPVSQTSNPIKALAPSAGATSLDGNYDTMRGSVQ
jgi:hypothetical protein